MGRPKIEIDEIELEKLAAMHCTDREIAAFFDCSVDTITDRFPELLAKGRSRGKARLRRLQWQAAEKGNVVMLIFLGKQYLDQSDKDKQESPEDRSQAVERLRMLAMRKDA